MVSSKNKFANKTKTIIHSKYYTIISKLTLLVRVTIVCWAALLIIMTGCTARISRVVDYGDFLNYEKKFVGSDLVVRVSIQERPEDLNFLMNRPFKSMKLFVVNIKMKNTGPNKLVINRQDIALITKDGRKFIPLKKKDAIARITGPMGIYRVLLLSNITYGYHIFGLDSQVVLNSGEEKTGYLFY